MTRSASTAIASRLADAAIRIRFAVDDYDDLVAEAGQHQFVLIGEATHGTHEFYDQRALITRRLISDYGFNAVAAEADWPDAYRVNCYVRGRSSAQCAEQALRGFLRFPQWMWRNTVVVDFVEWLKGWNATRRGADEQAGFYGLDLYSLYTSMQAVVEYLERVDPEAATRARYRYSCFEDYGENEQAYGYSAAINLAASCEEDAIAQLLELRSRAWQYARLDGAVAEDDLFAAEQNARLVANAEEYYRQMFGSRVSTWNLRDRHMADTLDELALHLERVYGRARVVVWEHNSHVGDARATDMGRRGEFNVGQLVRQRHDGEAYVIGFTTYHGAVTAADDWGGEARKKSVRPGLRGSYEDLFHGLDVPCFQLRARDLPQGMPGPLLERAIGVIYRPDTERLSHYFQARIGEQFDTVLHFDRTTALEPLERTAAWPEGDLPETYPFAE